MASTLSAEEWLRFTSFWFVRTTDIHPSHFDTLNFGDNATARFFKKVKNSLLSAPRALMRLSEKLCESIGLESIERPPSGHVAEVWGTLPEDTRTIVMLPPKKMEKQVVLATGCSLLSERLIYSLSGEEVRKFETDLGNRLHKSLLHLNVLSGSAYSRIPFEALSQVKPDNFLNEAYRVGLDYFLAACNLLDAKIALRVMLKLELRTAYMSQDEARPIVFAKSDQQRVWSFIHQAWKEIGVTCFAS